MIVGTRVYVITPQGYREEGTIVEGPYALGDVLTSRGLEDGGVHVAVEWDDGDVTSEHIDDITTIARST